MTLTRQNIKMIYTISVLVLMAALDNAVIGLFPPLFTSIAVDLKVQTSSLGFVSAVTIFVTAASSVVWGYLGDKGNRKRLVLIGTVLCAFSIFITAYCQNYIQLLLCQFLTGISLGCAGSIGFSILTDYIPKNLRGMLLSLWGLSQGFGGIAGSMMASVIATENDWRKPFIVLGILNFSFTFLYFFIKEPKKGSTDPELMEMVQQGQGYNYSIEFKQIKEILLKKTNKWLIIQGLFFNITIGTLIWLPTLYIAKIELLGYSQDTARVISGYLFAFLQIGGLSSMYFGYLGDRYQKKSHRGRSILTAFTNLAAIPLFVAMFVIPMKNLSLADNSDFVLVFFSIIKEIFTNPWLGIMFLLSIGATAAQSANTPNWLALITDINLPEHRATAFSIANLMSGIGRALGNFLIGIVLLITTRFFDSPNNYIIAMVLFQIFMVPSAISYFKISKRGGKDMRRLKSILRKRALKRNKDQG